MPPGIGTVARVFPPYDGLTDGATIVVRGTASSPQSVASVTVAGVAATSGDGFATWTATVPLALGANALSLSATTGTGGGLSGDEVVVTRVGVVPALPGSFVHDAANDVAYVLEPADSRLVRIGPGGSAVVAAEDVGAGEVPFNLYGLGVDLAAQTAYAAKSNGSGSAVIAIDLATGDRTELSGPSSGSGVAFQSLGDAAYDPGKGLYYVLDPTAATVVVVDVATGARTTVSGAGIGAGPAFTPATLNRIAPDFAANRLLVTTNGELFAVSVVTGDRTLLAGPALGTGPSLATVALAFAPAKNVAYVARNTAVLEVLAVDLATGNRTTLPYPAAPAGGDDAGAFTCMRYDAANDRLLGSDYAGSAIRAVDVTTGVRSEWFRVARGTGPQTPRPLGIGLLDDAHAVILDGTTSDALVRVDLATGDRSLLSGAGPALGQNARAMTIDPVGGRALVAGSIGAGDGLVGVDLLTGARTVVSPGGVGGGVLLSNPFALDTDGVTAWITNGTGTILAADLATGARTLLTDGASGAGPKVVYAHGVVAHPAAGVLYVAGGEAADFGVYAVSLASGDRTAVSTTALGSGPIPPTAASLQRDASGTSLLGATVLGSTSAASVTRYDLATGDRTVVSNAAKNPALGGTRLLRHLARPRADGILIGVDDDSNAVVALDPVTGERIVLSK